MRHEKTPAQIANKEDCDLRQVLNILTDDLLALVVEDVHAVDVQNFIQYFEHTWMSRIKFWNVYGLDKNRTNNHMEGWHCHLVHTIQNNPNIWKFITKIQSEQTAKDLEQNQMNQEVVIVPLTKKLKNKKRKLERSKQRYNALQITPLGMSHAFLI